MRKSPQIRIVPEVIMFEVYIGLGSNLEEPAEQVKQARLSLTKQAHITELGFSSLYGSPPMGPQDQPDYVNAVMRIDTDLSAIEVLKLLQTIENTQGRIRTDERWVARTLDLDLLLYANQEINLPDLIVPHCGLSKRAFVLYPLHEIAPVGLFVPGQGFVSELILHCPMNGLEKLV